MADVKRSLKSNNSTTRPQDLRTMIVEQAYYLAKQRGFEGGSPLHDWLEAEARIHRIYGKPACAE